MPGPGLLKPHRFADIHVIVVIGNKLFMHLATRLDPGLVVAANAAFLCADVVA
ncbi:hypothetical protein D3C76_1212550 [compost metagenome]